MNYKHLLILQHIFLDRTGVNYEILEDTMVQTPEGLMEVRIQEIVLTKKGKEEENIEHRARIITYPDGEKKRLIGLLTNDLDSDSQDIIDIYRKRWAIELLFKQIKQNFPLKYFYGRVLMPFKFRFGSRLLPTCF